MTGIHQTALVSNTARIGKDVAIGPYTIVGPDVVLDDGVTLHAHVVVDGQTHIGAASSVFPFASLGMVPQDLKYAGETSRLEIGANTVIREHVTMNPGTEGGGMVTRVGDNCLFMAGAHVAHDCQIGDQVIFANNATVAGHCDIGDFVILGGLSAVHQFVRIGKHAFIGGMTGIENDVIPFGTAIGNRANLGGLNLVGLKRRGFPREEIHALRGAYRQLFAPDGTLKDRVETIAAEFSDQPLVQEVVAFIRGNSDRSYCVPRVGGAD